MKIIIESTDQIIDTPELHARVWSGRTERGNAVDVFVSRIAANTQVAIAELSSTLREAPCDCPLSEAIASVMLHWKAMPPTLKASWIESMTDRINCVADLMGRIRRDYECRKPGYDIKPEDAPTQPDSEFPF